MIVETMRDLLRRTLRALLGKQIYRDLRARYACLRNLGWAYHPIWGHFNVPGALPKEEAVALFDAANGLAAEAPVLVEIGSWLGKSAIVLSQAIRNKQGILFCIDPFNADGDPESVGRYRRARSTMSRSVLDQFTHNIRSWGSYEHVRVLQGYSHQLSAEWSRSIDLLYIDGNHSYECARRDFIEWSPFIAPSGILVMHDVSFDPTFIHQGPARVVKELILGDPRWVHPRFVGFMFFACKAIDESGDGDRSDR